MKNTQYNFSTDFFFNTNIQVKPIYAADFLEVCSAMRATISSGLHYKMWRFI